MQLRIAVPVFTVGENEKNRLKELSKKQIIDADSEEGLKKLLKQLYWRALVWPHV